MLIQRLLYFIYSQSVTLIALTCWCVRHICLQNWYNSNMSLNQVWRTLAVLIEIFILCWNLPSDPKRWGWLKKKLLSLRGKSCLEVIFVVIWMKKTLIWFNLQRAGTRIGLSNIKDTFAESLQLQMSGSNQSMSIFQSSFQDWSLNFIWWLGKM